MLKYYVLERDSNEKIKELYLRIIKELRVCILDENDKKGLEELLEDLKDKNIDFYNLIDFIEILPLDLNIYSCIHSDSQSVLFIYVDEDNNKEKFDSIDNKKKIIAMKKKGISNLLALKILSRRGCLVFKENLETLEDIFQNRSLEEIQEKYIYKAIKEKNIINCIKKIMTYTDREYFVDEINVKELGCEYIYIVYK